MAHLVARNDQVSRVAQLHGGVGSAGNAIALRAVRLLNLALHAVRVSNNMHRMCTFATFSAAWREWVGPWPRSAAAHP